jgi:hypothetical protein
MECHFQASNLVTFTELTKLLLIFVYKIMVQSVKK